jgi:hypothetical protein
VFKLKNEKNTGIKNPKQMNVLGSMFVSLIKDGIKHNAIVD